MPYNDPHHVVKTSAQWDERAIEFWVVPRGCLCVELTPEGKTKIKIGEGNKFYSQLPYVNDMSDLENYYTKEEVDNIVTNINLMAIRSTDEYDTKNDLPTGGNKLGDVRFVKSSSPSVKTDPDVYLWNGSRWIYVGYELQDIDLSQYLKKDEFHELFDPVREKVEEMYPKMHTHENKNILDRIEEPYSTAEKEKLAGLENYDDTEIRELIAETGHTHPNKPVLDTITDDSLWSESDRTKFESLHNYDDTGVRNRLTDLESSAHTHSNKNILDQVTAAFTVEDKTKLDSLHNNEVFIGTDGMYGGREGLVPAPTIIDAGKFLCADGTWKAAGEIVYDFRGATASEDGTNGLVPAPLAGEQSYYLRGDGTWQPISGSDVYEAGPGIEIAQGTYETYRVVEYFQSNGSQTVNTGYCKTVANGSMNFEIKWRLVSTPTATAYVLSTHDVGASVNIGSVYIGVNKGSSMSEYKPCGGIITSSGGASSFQYDSSGTATSTRSDLAGFDDDGDISFNIGNLYSIDTGVTWRNAFLYDSTPAVIYFCKIFDDDVLVCDLVPCIRDKDNVQGFYDRVREIFIENTDAPFTMGQKTGEVISRFVHESESDPYEITNTGIIEASYSKQHLELTLRNRNETIVVPVSDTQYTAGDNIVVTGQQESFTLLQYIQGKGNQTINTHKRITSQEGKFEYKFQMKNALSTAQNYRNEAIICGEYFQEATPFIGIAKSNDNMVGSIAGIVKSNSALSWYWISQNNTTNLEEGWMAYHSDGTITKDGTNYTPGWPIINDSEIYIFGNHDAKSCCDLYYVKIYDNNVLIFDGIPVRRNSDGEIGLFDRVDNTFYMNDLGGGSFGFVAGPEVSGADPILGDYIGTTKTISATVGVTSVTQDSQNQNTLHVTTNGDTTDITIPDYTLPTASTSTLGGVIVGDGLDVNEDGVLSASGGTPYVAGDGIVISDGASSFELNENTVTNTEYFFNTRVTSNISGRIFTKYTTEPALGAVVYYGYTQPFFVGLTADSVKYGTNYDSHIWPNPNHPPFEYKGVTWYYSGNAYGMTGDGTDSSGHMQKLPGNYSVATEEDLQNIARAIIDAADIIMSPAKAISAKIGEGLEVDSNNDINVKIGDGLYFDADGAIAASGDDDYTAGEGIAITGATRPIDINYIRLDINNSRDNGSGRIIQFRNIRVLDNNGNSLQFSHASSIYGDGSAVEYGQNSRDESPQAMIEGRNKTCCTNFSLTKAPLKITFTLTSEISIANITSFSILTGADYITRDPVSWDIYASNDGVTWYKIQEAHSPDVTTARSTWITDIPFVIPPDAVEILPGVKRITAKLGSGLTFDANDAIELDNAIKIKLNCNNEPD